ncbi:CNNM domain-containing protein [Haloarchaeobius amylolyticus]|uniref:CNNM domain-containing protein n=1 Tax=Haloarchaeobius amylolyticus TaxID=1198296 RepID=UPI00226DCCDF|nr:hemolysin family protein [Haloarchaeobius amylolyticus]
MSELLTAVRLLGGFVLLLANGFFVGTEFAMTRVRQFSESEFTGHPGLERAWEMTEELEIYLSGCQVGITVCSIGLGVVAEPALSAAINPLFVAVGLAEPGSHAAVAALTAFALMNFSHVVIGEQAPTYFGVERTKTAAKYGSRPLSLWTKLMSPFIRLADRIAKAILALFGVEMTRSWAEEELEGEEDQLTSRAELRTKMGDVLSRSNLPQERRQEVIAAFEIGETPVSEIMVPIDEAVVLHATDDLETTLERMQEHPHTRFPLVGDGFDDYRGAVYTPAVLRNIEGLRAGKTDLADCTGEPMTIDAGTPVSDAIDQFQEAGEELALVERDGEVVGMLTPTDAWETITGEQTDPLDAS